MQNNELIFHASRTKAVLLLLGSVAFVAIGWWLKEQQPVLGWACVIFFVLGIPVALSMLLPGVIYLRLDQDGFEMRSMGRKNRGRWQNVQSFRIQLIRSAKMIAIHYHPNFKDRKMVRAVAGALSGVEGAIPKSYNVPLTELEHVLNQWRERFGRVDT